MSSELTISAKDVQAWLKDHASSNLEPIHSRAQKIYDEMQKSLENLNGASQILMDNSQKEIEKRNPKTFGRSKALNKLARLFIERIKQIRAKEDVTYDNLHRFLQETQKALTITEVDMRNYFQRISPYFILDRRKFQIAFEKTKSQCKIVSDFMEKEYVKVKDLEETFQLIERLYMLQEQLLKQNKQKDKTESEKTRVEKEIARIELKISETKKEGGLYDLTRTTAEIESLGNEIRQSIHHVQKPFIKLRSMAERGEGSGLTPEELEKLKHYVENPFEGLSTEKPDLPILKSILNKLNRMLSENRLKLKSDKMRKAEQLIESILKDNSLDDLYQRSISIRRHRKKLLETTGLVTSLNSLSMLQEQLEELERRKRIVESEQISGDQTLKEIKNRIGTTKTDIEKNILAFTDKKISID